MEVKSNLAVNGLGGEIGALAVELSLEKEREGLFFDIKGKDFWVRRERI